MKLSKTLPILLALMVPAAAQDRPASERTVYVPIEDFDSIFSKERGGVFVPYKELRELIRRAERNRPVVTAPDAKPPADYLLVGASFEGQAGDRVVQFTATFDIEVLENDAWVVVPIGLKQASLEEVRTAGGARAAVGPMSLLSRRVAALDKAAGRKGRPALPTEGYGIILKGAGRVQTTATFALPIDTQPGRSSFQLSLPRTALVRFEVTLPQAGLAVNVKDAKGRALATEITSVDGVDATKLRAYFGEGAHAAVSWNPRVKEIEGAARDPLLFARTETSMRLDEGVLQTTTRIDYRILQAPCGEFKVRFPKGFTLLRVTGQNMSAYPTPTATAGGQLITIRLHEKAKDTYSLQLGLEKILKDGTESIAFPRIGTVGTERESGILAARTSEFLTLEPDRFRGLSQIDATALTPALISDLKWNRRGRPPLVFRYLRQPYDLSLKSKTIEPEVDGKVFTLASVRDDEIGLATIVRYTIRKRGIFGVRLSLPAGITDQSGILRCGDERVVKDYRVETPSADEKKKGVTAVLVVDFVNQIKPGTFNLLILAQIARPDHKGDGEVRIKLPRFGLLDVQKETGVLAVGGQTHLEISDDKKAIRGLTNVATRELRGLGFTHGAPSGESITLAYKYLKPESVVAEFGVKKRASKLTAKVETLVDAQEDRVRVDITIWCTVEYAGIEQLEIRVPAALATKEELKFDREGLKFQTPKVQEDGSVIWTVAFQGKKLGTFPVKLNYDIKLENFQAGDAKEVQLHEIEVLSKCFSETGDIALKKHENLVVTEVAMDSIEKRDKRELSEALRRQGPIQAYRYVSHPHNLVLRVTKYDFRAPLGMLINHLHHDEVLARDGKLKAEASLSLQNNAQQYLTVLLPKNAVMRGLKLDGKSEEWSEGVAVEGRPSVQVHLGEVTKKHRDAAFQVQLRYNVPLSGDLSGVGRLELQTLRFPLEDDKEVPVARLTRSLYLPGGFNYLEFNTDATKHFAENSLWENLKTSLGVRTGREGTRNSWYAGKQSALSAVVDLKGMSAGGADAGLYPTLELPQAQDPYLFEKLDNPSRLTVSYASWSSFYIIDLLALLAVVGLGVFLTIRKLAGSVAYVAISAGLAVLGAAFLGKATEPYFASGLAGAVGLGCFFLTRGLWRELTVLRHERRLAELGREEELARTRATAAGAAPAETPAPAEAAKPAKKEVAAPTAEETAAADRITLEAQGEAPAADAPAADAPVEDAPADDKPADGESGS